MRAYVPTHLSDAALTHELIEFVSQERPQLAEGLGRLAEFDARRLFRPAGFPSMFEYCVRVLRFSEDVALKRIRAARIARRFPAIFDALADGRLHLSGVVLLKPHLTRENADRLLTAAANKTKGEIEQMLAERFPRTELMTWVQPLGPSAPPDQSSPTRVEEQVAPGPVGQNPARVEDQVAPGPVESAALAPRKPQPAAAPRDRVTPLAPQRFGLQASIRQETHDLLREAQELSGHDLPTGDIDELLNRALGVYVRLLRKRRFAATDRPRRPRRGATGKRTIPAEVQRAVWERDGGQCTYVSDAGHRCTARTEIEYDHIEPVARGGRATVDNLRLRCRTHNQYEAELTFGAGFMSEKRAAARRSAAEARARAAAAETNVPRPSRAEPGGADPTHRSAAT